jgi:hypothetical protein
MEGVLKRSIVIVLMISLVAVISFAEDREVIIAGKTIIIHDNYTWEYKSEDASIDANILSVQKKSNQTKMYESSMGKFKIWYDGSKWDITNATNQSVEITLQNKDRSGFAAVVYEGIKIPLDNLEQIVLINAKKVDPNAMLTHEEKCTVNGIEGKLITYSASTAGLMFIFEGFITSNDAGSIQFTFYTLDSEYSKLKDDFIEAIGGLEI